jgi:hypothetical protein
MYLRFASVFLCLVLPATATDTGTNPWRGPDMPVYVITQNHYAEGFVPEGETAKFSDLLAIEIYSPSVGSAHREANYKVGEHLLVFSGGQKQGQVKIEKVAPLQCDSTAAIVAPEPSVHLAKDAMALASNAKGIGGHPNHLRSATSEEKELAMGLAMTELEKRGVPASAKRNIEIEQLLVTKIDQAEGDFLIGYMNVKSTGTIHEIFELASLSDSKVKAELVRYHQTKDIEDGMDSEGYRFVDQLDLDGDGTDEIVVEVTGYESEEFRILKRLNGAWVRVHVGGQGGC